jgi:predicted DNA binding CopG/RHH family protein
MAEGRDPVTGMTDEEMQQAAQDAYAARDDDSAWEDVEVEVAAQARSVVSVRFGPEELAAVERAASQAGLAVSTYIRNAALAGADALDLDSVRRAARALLHDAEQVNRLLGTHPAA